MRREAPVTSFGKPPTHALSAGNGIVVVGAGLAGLFTALKLAPLPVTVISPTRLGEGASSLWAQAGIAAALAEGDTPEDHAADTIRAGAGIVDEAVALFMAQEARERIEDLLRYGVPFDKDLEGRLSLSHEAAHRSRRIRHVKRRHGRPRHHGRDHGGRARHALDHRARSYTARDLIVRHGRVRGIALAPADGETRTQGLVLPARAVVLATGGAGQVYAITTNPHEARGEGVAIAARAGAVVADAEFVQFHPTAIDIGRDPAPLATEALRGEGALLINSRGERFMRAVHEDAELGPRDVVARAVHREVVGGRGAFLDCRPLGPALADHFPAVVETCRSAGIDPVTEPIPVAPAAITTWAVSHRRHVGRSTVDGLWACGEVASTGAHGANRLASNSLLEAVVFGALANDIAATLPPLPSRTVAAQAPLDAPRHHNAKAEHTLRHTMAADAGVVRDAQSLITALTTIVALERESEGDPQLANMLTTAKLIASAALVRTESRGAQFRSDYPASIDAQAKRSFLTLSQADAIARKAAGASSPPRLRVVAQ
ncbi:L-aspartate oxidase [Methyloceanibacter superfactus]|uniref:L-aspartate oxidase n=1 Tax=Methyloceanibacter superfactus TaxID=1774969 RepID=UPI000A592CA4|nr:L-aspartate oxidase [Methyloceanibacter superfactus]